MGVGPPGPDPWPRTPSVLGPRGTKGPPVLGPVGEDPGQPEQEGDLERVYQGLQAGHPG